MFALVNAATVVPHEPAPITPTLIAGAPPGVVRVFISVPHPARVGSSACARPHRSATHPLLTSYTRRVDVAVLVPVKAFTEAKQRLSTVLSPSDRARLARWLADGVVRSLGATPVFVVCDDPAVRTWATDAGATALWTAQLGLNGAVDDGVAAIAAEGFAHVVVTHADLPLPAGLVDLARPNTSTFVPDRRRDGTNVMSFPTDAPIPARYGPGSFRQHRTAATTPVVEVRFDHHLSIDLDSPSDLTHPLLREVLPAWLPTIPVNHYTQRRS